MPFCILLVYSQDSYGNAGKLGKIYSHSPEVEQKFALEIPFFTVPPYLVNVCYNMHIYKVCPEGIQPHNMKN